MANLDNLCDILMNQIDFMSCDDNFNKEDGTFDQSEFDRTVVKCDAIVNLSKQVIEIAKTQLNALDTACKWNVNPQEMPKSIGNNRLKIEQNR